MDELFTALMSWGPGGVVAAIFFWLHMQAQKQLAEAQAQIKTLNELIMKRDDEHDQTTRSNLKELFQALSSLEKMVELLQSKGNKR